MLIIGVMAFRLVESTCSDKSSQSGDLTLYESILLDIFEALPHNPIIAGRKITELSISLRASSFVN